MATRQIRVNGRVQGIGYRDALRREAERRGVTGWVRNRADGSVEAVLQGSAGAIEEVIAWARRGPVGARVAELRSDFPEAQFDRAYARFEQWPSA